MGSKSDAPRDNWSNQGHYLISYPDADNPPRQGCRWSPREDFDVLDWYTAGQPIEELCSKHGRSANAICVRLFGFSGCDSRALAGAQSLLKS